MVFWKKTWPVLAGCIFAFSWLIIVLLTSVELTAFDRNFYIDQYQKGGQAAKIGTSQEELMKVTDEMLRYLRGERSELDMKAQIDGNIRPFFNQRERDHMDDVQILFINSFRLRRIAIATAFVSLLLLLFLRKKGAVPIIGRCCFWAALALTVFLVLVGVALVADFTAAFTQFHKIFFSNDLWILDPRTDLLIRMVPESFFIATASRIVITLSIGLLVTIVISFLAMRSNSFMGRDQ